jgi:hypothetical protein
VTEGSGLIVPTASEWLVTGLTGIATIKLDESTKVYGTYTITVKDVSFPTNVSTTIEVAPQKSFVAEITENNLQVSVSNTSAVLNVTLQDTDTYDASFNVEIEKDGTKTNNFQVDWEPPNNDAINFDVKIIPIVDANLLSGTYIAKITANTFVTTTVAFTVLEQAKLSAFISTNSLRADATDTFAVLEVAEQDTASAV